MPAAPTLDTLGIELVAGAQPRELVAGGLRLDGGEVVAAGAPFRPVLRGRLLTSGAPLYLHSRPSGQSLASTRALWSPPEKIAGRYLAPYLATARLARIAAAPLAARAGRRRCSER